MQGISSKALQFGDPGNRFKYNGNEEQRREFSDGSGWETYDFNARTYDAQIARFIQIDPLSEEGGQDALTPYQFSFNNPIRFNDPGGECPVCPLVPVIAEAVKAVVALTVAYYAGNAIAESIDIQNVSAPAINTEGFGDNDFVPLSAQLVRDKYRKSVVSKSVSGTTTENNLTPIPTGDELALVKPGTFTKVSSNLSPAGDNKWVLNSSSEVGKRRQNRIGDKGEPNSVQTNPSGTTVKKYGPDGNVQKEFNKGHGSKVPNKNERKDHIHDYKPNPQNPSGRGTRMPGRAPKKNEVKKDFGL